MADPSPEIRFSTLELALNATLDRLARDPLGGYAASDLLATEPVAWSTRALMQAGRVKAATAGAQWLSEQQQADGSVGVTAEQRRPAWTTAPAILAWLAVDREGYAEQIDRAIAWAVEQEPWTAPKTPTFGHDTQLEGWSWAADTHSWIEPTAFFVKALSAAGHADHPRVEEGVRLLVDRLLPSGGANYGNTVVLGQELLQHVQSSGVVVWTLAEVVEAETLEKTIAYLEEAISEPTGVASLSYAALGLASAGRVSEELVAILADAASRAEKSGGVYKAALYASACQAVLSVREG